LTDIPLSVSAVGAGVGFGSLSLDDLALPEGDVIVLGIVANLSFTSEDANIAATWSGDFSIGTKATIDADLVDDDEANLLPSTAIAKAEELKGQKAPKAPKAKKVQEDKKGEDGAQ
jgi:hypothetical protein